MVVDGSQSSMAALRKLVPAFDRYFMHHFPQMDRDRVDLLFEADYRFGQIRWIVERIDILEAEEEPLLRRIGAVGMGKVPHDAQVDAKERALNREILLLTETFYYIAWRFRELARQLPGLGKFDPSGVRDVRNHLLVHPPDHGAGFPMSFRREPGSGWKLRDYRDPQTPDVPQDAGLTGNVVDFFSELLPRLERAVPQGESRRQPNTRMNGPSATDG